ncbi:Hypothetical predicted protein [Mytilus galloprovincialis]|uniref:B box-type domain-containing protein n=1 Tax=Mytilus galloprovincialis TaxID=29158 RepID=A0A8B6FCV8_MYTGA|nr:Hypothetical predicted protein [Mytilus galloprovincialis]
MFSAIKKFQNYCPQHESIGCPLCIQSNHANCVGILSLENVIQTAKTSVLLTSLGQNLKDIKLIIERVVKDRKLNLVIIQNQREKFHDEIKQITYRIKEHLDKIEQIILQDLYAAEEKVKSQVEDLLGKLAEHTEKLDLLQNNTSAIKEYASDLQAFLGSKMIEKEVKKHEIFMESLFEDGSLKKIDLNCTIEEKISDLVSAVTSFGSISEEKSSPLVVGQTEKFKQAQIRTFRRAPTTTINHIKMTFKRKYEFSSVTACAVSCTQDVFMVDYTRKRLLVLKEDGTLENEILLSDQNPADVTCIDDKIVAVSFPYSNQIQIINVLTKTIEFRIHTTNDCYGICYSDGHLFYCETGRGIQKVKVSSSYSSTLVKDNTLSNWSYVTTSKDKICYTNSSKNTIACCTITGGKMWEYKDQSISLPYGIAVDKDSNVYVASTGDHSIVVLSSDGKQARKLLGREDGIENTFGLAFNVKKEVMLVANYNGPILYELC